MCKRARWCVDRLSRTHAGDAHARNQRDIGFEVFRDMSTPAGRVGRSCHIGDIRVEGPQARRSDLSSVVMRRVNDSTPRDGADSTQM